MNRRQEPLWKTARMQQEPTLPDLPPFMSEPAYANLMFFKDCYVSSSSRNLRCRLDVNVKSDLSGLR